MQKNYRNYLKEFQKNYGLSNIEIGRAIEVSSEAISSWRTGRHKPSEFHANRLMKFIKNYKKEHKAVTTQVSIFEDDATGQVMQVVTTTNFHGQPLDIYGDTQAPWFRAKDVASMIDYSVASMNKFLQSVDEDEKERKNIPTPGGIQKTWFLTEQGLYEVLFQSRKPIAKEFKKVVKQALKEIRLNGYYMAGELVEQPQTTIPEAECQYIDSLARGILDAKTLTEKERLGDKIYKFTKELIFW